MFVNPNGINAVFWVQVSAISVTLLSTQQDDYLAMVMLGAPCRPRSVIVI